MPQEEDGVLYPYRDHSQMTHSNAGATSIATKHTLCESDPIGCLNIEN